MTRITDNRYILKGGVNSVFGWLDGGAITATVALNNWQKRHGVVGKVAEIGVHHGKFFLVLKNLCGPDETAIAVDVFDDQDLNIDKSGRGDRAVFDLNVAEYSDGLNVDIIQSDSTLLTHDRLVTPGKGGRIRLFSIDGSHTMEHTLSDLNLASASLADGGVIILDDLYNPEWPGVQQGFHHFMSKRGEEFAPLALANNKLFICSRSDQKDLSRVFRHDLAPYYVHRKDVVIWATEAVLVSLPSPENVFSANLSIPRNFFIFCTNRLSADCLLQTGWSIPEADGTWTMAERAIAELRLVDEPKTAGMTALQLEMMPFLHSRRDSRKVDIYVNDSFVGSRLLNSRRMERIDIPIDAKALRKTTSVRIDIDSPERPSDLGLSTDPRPLGIKVKSMKISDGDEG